MEQKELLTVFNNYDLSQEEKDEQSKEMILKYKKLRE